MKHILTALRRNQPCPHLNFILQPPELWDNKFLFFEALSFLYFVTAIWKTNIPINWMLALETWSDSGWKFWQEYYLGDIVPFICSSVAQTCPILWDPMDYSMPGFPFLHYLPEFAQTHVRWVGDAIQLSHPLSTPSPFALNLSQHQGLFQWVNSSHQVAKVLELQSVLPMNVQSWFPLGLTGLYSL